MSGMTSRRILAEIRDLRMEAGHRDERANQLMAENRELTGEIRTELALSRKERAGAIAFYEEQRGFYEEQRREMRAEVQLTREVIRRNELAFKENSRILSSLVEAVRELREELREEMRAQTEEVRAQTRAIFKLIDRLDGGAATA